MTYKTNKLECELKNYELPSPFNGENKFKVKIYVASLEYLHDDRMTNDQQQL